MDTGKVILKLSRLLNTALHDLEYEGSISPMESERLYNSLITTIITHATKQAKS